MGIVYLITSVLIQADLSMSFVYNAKEYSNRLSVLAEFFLKDFEINATWNCYKYYLYWNFKSVLEISPARLQLQLTYWTQMTTPYFTDFQSAYFFPLIHIKREFYLVYIIFFCHFFQASLQRTFLSILFYKKIQVDWLIMRGDDPII